MLQSYHLLQLIFFYNGLSVAIFAARIAPIKLQLDIAPDILGKMLLASPIGAIICMSGATYLAAKYGSRMIIGVTALLSLIATMLFLLIPNIFMVTFSIFIFGASVGLMDVAMNAQAVQLELRMRRTIMNGLHGLWSFGTLFGAGFISLVIYLQFSILITVMSLTILLAFTIYFGKHRLLDDRHISSNLEAKAQKPLSLPPLAVLPLGLLLVLSVAPESILLEWSGLWFVETLQKGEEWQANGVLVVALAMMVSRLLGNKLTDYFGKSTMVYVGTMIAFFGMLCIVALNSLPSSIIGMLIFGLGIGNISPIIYQASGNIPNVSPAQGLAGLTVIGYGSFMVAPWLMGEVTAAFGLRFAFTCIMFMPLIAFFWSFFSLRDIQKNNHNTD